MLKQGHCFLTGNYAAEGPLLILDRWLFVLRFSARSGIGLFVSKLFVVIFYSL